MDCLAAPFKDVYKLRIFINLFLFFTYINVLLLLTGPQLIVGSSIGGWIGLLGAIERPQRIHSIVTIANAADFANTRFLLYSTPILFSLLS